MAVYKKERFSKRKNKVVTTWMAKFTTKDEHGKSVQHKKEGFALRREAEDYEKNYVPEWVIRKQEEERKVKEPTVEELEAAVVAEKGILFYELYETYMRHISMDIKVTTYDTKESIITTKILPFFGDFHIKEITPADVKEWQYEVKQMGFKDTYLKTIHNQLSAILNYGMRFHDLPTNAARECGKMGEKNAGRVSFYTVEEFNKFIEGFEDRPVEKMMYTLLFYTGIRSGELLALTLGDFDLSNNTVSINKTYVRRKKKDLIQKPKTKASIRVVPIPAFVVELLKEYFEGIPELYRTDRVFPLTKSHLHKHMKEGIEKTELHYIRVHDLRHSYASMLINMNVQMKAIQQLLGHANITTTVNIYSHLYPSTLSAVAEQVNERYSVN